MFNDNNSGKPQRVAIYCRVSTEEQREKQSIATQKEFCERLCMQLQIPIADVYLDDGISGTVPLDARPEGARLLRDARDKRFESVLIYKLDRLGRDSRLILNAVSELEALGIQVESATQDLDAGTSTGRFLLTILSGVAGLERYQIVERSMEGTARLARQGAWLGGIVPFGYRVEEKDRDARLVVSEDPLPGLDLSEADVIRLIYRLAADEHQSCPKIADHLNSLGVPPSYAKDGRMVLRGKRKQVTAAVWRPGRVRNLLVNTTYKGVHHYGKRSKRVRQTIEREAPAIVTPEIWDRAQQVLRDNFIYNPRNAKRQYLLRGLMKCALCGLTYIGTASRGPKGLPKIYYRCNGKHNGRKLSGLPGHRCPAKDLNGSIEEVVWGDIEDFGRHLGPVLAKLADLQQAHGESSSTLLDERKGLEKAIGGKAAERDMILDLYRRQRIGADDLDRQMGKIAAEERTLKVRAETVREQARQAESAVQGLTTAEELLRELNQRLDEPRTWEIKRTLVEALVDSVKVDTVEVDGVKRAEVTVSYRFASTESRRDTDS